MPGPSAKTVVALAYCLSLPSLSLVSSYSDWSVTAKDRYVRIKLVSVLLEDVLSLSLPYARFWCSGTLSGNLRWLFFWISNLLSTPLIVRHSGSVWHLEVSLNFFLS